MEDTVRYGDAQTRSMDAWEGMVNGYPNIYEIENEESTDDTLGMYVCT